VTPYFTQQTPPAFVAMLPPIVDHGELAGSGAYQSPCSAAAARRWSLTTPGSTTASRSVTSMRRIRFIDSRDSTTPPATALAPPDRPVPAPRATTGTPCAAHAATTARTSAVDA